MKKTIEELRVELVGQEISFLSLNNQMVRSGYYSIMDDGITDNIKNDLNIVYTATDTVECEVVITFEITIDNDQEESEEAFYLKVTDVEKF